MFKGFIFFFFLLLTQTVFASTGTFGLGISFSRPILDKTSFDAQSRNDVYMQANVSHISYAKDTRIKLKGGVGYYYSEPKNPEDIGDFFSSFTDAPIPGFSTLFVGGGFFSMFFDTTGYLGNERDLFQPYLGGGIGVYWYGAQTKSSLRLEGEFPNYHWVQKDASLMPDITIRPYLFAGIRLDFQSVYLDFEYMHTFGIFKRYSEAEQNMLKFELGIPIKTN